MDLLSVILFLVFIVAPAVTIYAFVSRIGSGVYHWADRQHPEPHYEYHDLEYEPPKRRAPYDHSKDIIDDTKPMWTSTTLTLDKPKSKKKKHKPEAKQPKKTKEETLEEYFGFDPSYEDSKRFERFLDKQPFDVRDYLNGKNS